MQVLSRVQTIEPPAEVLQRFEAFTGLTYGTDEGFEPAVATVVAQTMLSVFLTLTAFVLVLFLVPPIRFFTGWTNFHGDKRPAYMAFGLFAVLLVIVNTPVLANYFALFQIPIRAAAVIGLAVILWAFLLRFIWRAKLLERFLELDVPR